MSDVLCSVLVIDSDNAVVETVERALSGLSVVVLYASDNAEGAARCRELLVNIILLDASLDEPGVRLHELFGDDCAIDIVLMASEASPVSASEASARGASEILSKPLDTIKLHGVISRFLAEAKTRRRTKDLDDELLGAYQFEGMVGRSPAMLQVFSIIRRAAPLFQTALVTGETGTGKELVARAMHNLSPRSQQRFVVCNCSALVETLLESQLFGHMKGAFTGALQDKAGLFEYADRGTIFLDEVGELTPAAQATLLRVLQNGELQRVGSPVVRTVDVHIIAATNRNLRQLVNEGKYREDLFYRLSSIEIHLPPLSERKEDLSLLFRHFLRIYSARYNKPVRGFSRRAQFVMAQYPWPGNVRELENVIANVCIMAESDVIFDLDLPERLREHGKKPKLADPGLITFEELRARHLQFVLSRVGGNKERAAEILGVSRATIYDMLARLGQRQLSKGASGM